MASHPVEENNESFLQETQEKPILTSILNSDLTIISRPSKITDFLIFGPEIGEGAAGVVKLCQIIENSELLVCKIVTKQPKFSDEIRAEAKALLMLQTHHSVVRIHRIYEDEKCVYFVMEYCEGGDLFSRVKQRRFFREEDAATITQKLALALRHFHQVGIMHRDLKPENILMVSKYDDTDIRLADFGSACFFTPGQRLREVVGSSLYLAPSILEKNYDQEADLWSLGVVLYIMLCGAPPFNGSTNQEIFHKIRFGGINVTDGQWQFVSEEAKSVVLGLLERDPEKRLRSQQVLDHNWIQGRQNDGSHETENLPVAQVIFSNSFSPFHASDHHFDSEVP